MRVSLGFFVSGLLGLRWGDMGITGCLDAFCGFSQRIFEALQISNSSYLFAAIAHTAQVSSNAFVVMHPLFLASSLARKGARFSIF